MISKISICILAIVLSIQSGHSAGTDCPKIIKPVCGSDEKTYANSCEAAKNDVTFEEGKCAECSYLDDIVCADGIQYYHWCEAEESGQTDYTFGECECTEEWAPVCSKDGQTYGQTYDNKCEARRNNQTYTEGQCPGPINDKVVCTSDFKPVCTNDDKTYSNECHAKNYGYKEFTEGACSDYGKNNTCTYDYFPVCNNHYIYPNECWAKKDGVTDYVPGECEDEQDDWKPVCANNETFSSKHFAEESGFTNYTAGECPGYSEKCLADNDPVCANNVTYQNVCFAGKAGVGDFEDYTFGACKNYTCPADYEPVCAGSETFSNECEAKHSGKSDWVSGECEVICYEDYVPVCGNNKTFTNACFADKAEVDFYTAGECEDQPE